MEIKQTKTIKEQQVMKGKITGELVHRTEMLGKGLVLDGRDFWDNDGGKQVSRCPGNRCGICMKLSLTQDNNNTKSFKHKSVKSRRPGTCFSDCCGVYGCV